MSIVCSTACLSHVSVHGLTDPQCIIHHTLQVLLQPAHHSTAFCCSLLGTVSSWALQSAVPQLTAVLRFCGWCADLPACGAQSVPARLNRLTNEDDAWEPRTLMPGGLHSPLCLAPVCLHCALHRAGLVPEGAWMVSAHALACVKGTLSQGVWIVTLGGQRRQAMQQSFACVLVKQLKQLDPGAHVWVDPCASKPVQKLSCAQYAQVCTLDRPGPEHDPLCDVQGI